jgi:hypothetical protein
MTDALTEKLNEFLKDAKPLHELVVEAAFAVEHVLSEQTLTQHPRYEAAVGGSSPLDNAGYSFKTTLTVTPTIDNPDIATRKLVFNGYTSAPRNSHIIVKIPAFEAKNGFYARLAARELDRELDVNGQYFVARPLALEETAIEIDIRNVIDCIDNKIISTSDRTERSVDYKDYMKKD